MRTRRKPRQLDLFAARKRKAKRGQKLGRPVTPGREGYEPHLAREPHDARHPVHVSMHRAAAIPSFREQMLARALLRELARASSRGLRVLHHSIEPNHLHAIVEADDQRVLTNELRTLFSRMAFAVNRLLRRHGRVFRDRHHRRALTTPREMRSALIYVMFNDRHHHHGSARTIEMSREQLDPLSSALWFTGWDPRSRPDDEVVAVARSRAGPCPLAAPLTWIARDGWKRAGGLVRFDTLPRLVVEGSVDAHSPRGAA